MDNNKKIFFSIILILILGALATVLLQSASAPDKSGKYDNFAKCLASKELTMYGAAWCSHCIAEKNRFGDSFKYVPYVECTENPDKCVKDGIEGTPTWIDRNGQKYVGEQGLEGLSKISGCELPVN